MMEKTRVSLLQRFGTFIKSLTNSEEDSTIDETKLSKKEQEIVKKLKEMDNTGDIERNLRDAVKIEKKTGNPIITKKSKQPSNVKTVKPAEREIGD